MMQLIILSLERLRKFDYDTLRNHRHTFKKIGGNL